jgi:hypothetical protein
MRRVAQPRYSTASGVSRRGETRGDGALTALDDIPMGMRPARPFCFGVIGTTAAVVVQSLGGWICDKVWEGCNVRVSVVRHGDARALQILGVKRLYKYRPDELMQHLPSLDGLAVTAELVDGDAGVAQVLRTILNLNRLRPTVWGQDAPTLLDTDWQPGEYRPSIAAQAFKAHAVMAAGQLPTTTSSESFRCASGVGRPPLSRY